MINTPPYFTSTLLRKGYFPKELPPPFTTRPFSEFAVDNPTYIDNLWSKYVTKLVKHNLARPGTNRRVLGIPNPINQLRLVQAIENVYPEIIAKTNSSPYASSKPSFQPRRRSSRSLSPKWVGKTLSEYKASVRSCSRYIVKADINRFYPSIYTHSIPWALHSKQEAKRNRRETLSGNVIDKAIREAQDEQTIGIPIGPDTSFLISELILSQVDIDVATLVAGSGWRWYDDYEVGFWELSDAEKFRANLEGSLAEYELEISSEKTQIQILPQPLHDNWINQLRAYDLNIHPIRQSERIIDLFNTAFELSRIYPKGGVLKYAVKKLYAVQDLTPVIHEYNWNLVQHLVLQSAAIEPDVLPTVLGLISFYNSFNRDTDDILLAKVLSLIIKSQCQLGHSSEVAWAIWGFIEFNLKIPSDVVDQATQIDDDIVSLCILHAKSVSLIDSSVSMAFIEQRVLNSGFESQHWLLAYESYRQGWLGSPYTDEVVKSQRAKDLLADGVYFYRTTLRQHESARHFLGAPRRLVEQLSYSWRS